MSFYTRKGDDGTTGLYFGGRVRKDAPAPEALGAVDEAQAAIGCARAESERGSELDGLLLEVERHLYVLMAELATAPENHHKLVDGQSRTTADMVGFLEARTDDLSGRFVMPDGFVLPGQNRISAQLELARTVVRRAERAAVAVAAAAAARSAADTAAADGTHVVPYLNRLSSLLWAAARWQEGETGPISAKEH